jgi:hypothetical protein
MLTIKGCTISGNSSSGLGVNGGGGINNAAGATATVSGSSILANCASGAGGGVANAGTLGVSSSLLLANAAGGDGVGLYNAGAATLELCLVTGNTAAGGGGIYAAPTGSVALTNKLVLLTKQDNIQGSVTFS